MNSAYECSMDLCRYIKNQDCSPSEVERLWRRVFEAFLISNRFTRASIDYMWKNLVYGNWEKLWVTEEEVKRTSSEWLEDIRLEVFYCSDRWSLDRLCRCHWRWRRYMQAARKEGLVDG